MDSTTKPPNPALPYREDCWSEGETSVLVDAWGDRYLELNRGNLRQKHWQEVADAVNSRAGAGRRPARTDVQCKNRIDTLKKKYKVEKARISAGAESQWPFFFRLDVLIGSSPPPKKPPSSPPLALPLPFHRKGTLLPAATAVRSAEPKGKRSAATALSVDNPILRRAAAAAEAAAEDIKDEDDVGSDSPSRSSSRSARGWKKAKEGEGNGIRELARAIARFADIYERVEGAKQRQMMELEKQRMEFTKTLEFQKMQLIVDTQVQIAKIKRAKRSGTDGYL
ncbi:trihelix transcription factor ENAP2-like [Curcuma longa]|uniref:trihelix transcription factor ENAP2-like n=1 Tax=Curcuma longa TaxID=136217 RepID=UPI003D9F628A